MEMEFRRYKFIILTFQLILTVFTLMVASHISGLKNNFDLKWLTQGITVHNVQQFCIVVHWEN